MDLTDTNFMCRIGDKTRAKADEREVCAALKFEGSAGIFPLSHSFLLSPLHVDFFPLPGQEQHSEPFFSLNAAAARRDYICVELSPQMLISCRLKVKAYASTAAFPRALGFLTFESESVCELKMETCCR